MYKTIIISQCTRKSSNLRKMTRCLATSCPHLTKASFNANIDQKYNKMLNNFDSIISLIIETNGF
jgi:ATP adenylyltransferase/5',5'''-P-1,P-4-tetraphosphate phosphorylase II